MESIGSILSTTHSSFQIQTLLNFYISLHGFAYAVKFKWKLKNIFFIVFSTLFIIINDINKLYLIAYQIIFWKRTRRHYSRTLLLILEYLLRILYFLKRKKFKYLNWHIDKICSMLIPHNTLQYKNKLILVLLINDIYIIVKTFLWLVANDYIPIMNGHDNNITSEYKSSLSSLNNVYIFSIFLEKWGTLTPFISVYFCCFCFTLKHTINGYKKKLEKQQKVGVNSLDKICTEISNLTYYIYEVFHDFLILVFIILLVNVFYHTYIILVNYSMTEILLYYRIFNIVFYFIQFVAICMCSSSASKAGFEFKRMIYNHKFKTHERWTYFQLVTKINDNFVEFKLLDSLAIDKNLILATVGSLITYGIIIATFNINSTI